jgi:hypothetical protein
MARIAIELDWVRDPKGYRLAETGRPKMLRIVRNGTGNKPEDFQSWRPLASTDLLFKIFANIASTPDGVLKFVSRFGSLTYEGWDPTKGEPVNSVMRDADHMRQVLRFWDGRQKQPHLLGPPPSTGPSRALDAMVVWDPATEALKWEFRPKTLLDALWLQLGQALTVGAEIRQCEHCGDWFEVGRGTGRRLDSKFCSDEHRIAFNSLKRSREK